jgi:hypothetical protein
MYRKRKTIRFKIKLMDINKLAMDSDLYIAILDTRAEINKQRPLAGGHIDTIGDRMIFLRQLEANGFELKKKKKDNPVQVISTEDESLASIILNKDNS